MIWFMFMSHKDVLNLLTLKFFDFKLSMKIKVAPLLFRTHSSMTNFGL